MDHVLKKIEVRMSFEAALRDLMSSLQNEGFVVCGTTDFCGLDNKIGTSRGKYKVLTIYNPGLYSEMVALSPYEGIAIPINISIIEIYPGQIALIPHSTDGAIAEKHHDLFQNLRREVIKKLSIAVHALEQEQFKDPDLVTSWS